MIAACITPESTQVDRINRYDFGRCSGVRVTQKRVILGVTMG